MVMPSMYISSNWSCAEWAEEWNQHWGMKDHLEKDKGEESGEACADADEITDWRLHCTLGLSG